jgi:hypothetical protein
MRTLPAILGTTLAVSCAVGAMAVSAQAAPAKSAKTYVGCTSPAVSCTGGERMQSKPSQMGFSADGSLYVTGIHWRGWGTAKAIGTGTAHADNCTPNCAQGHFSEHPATIVFSNPKPWDGKLAYSHAIESVPAIKWYYTFSQGLVP